MWAETVRRRTGPFLLALFSALAPADADAPAAPDLDLSAADPAIPALRRVQARSGLLMYDQAFPQSVSTLRNWLKTKPLSASDSSLILARHPYAGGELVRWNDAERTHSFFFSPLVELGAAGSGGDDSIGRGVLTGLGGRIHGRMGENFTYFTRVMVYSEKTGRAQFTHQFDPELGETYSVEKGLGDSLLDFRTYNRFEYYVKYSRPWWSVKAGRDKVHMGPGYFSSLTATRDTPPYYLLEGRLDFASWLALDTYLLKMTDTDHDIPKYANLHRLEFKPLRSLALAYQDMVIYQDRDPDPAYFLPFVPLTFAEANSGGRDNAAMSLDAIWAAPGGVSIWGELFMDDLLGPTSFFDDFWENRWAALAGFQWVLPPSWADADLVVEWSHVEPWTYNGRKPQTSFKHFNVPSASKLGPDSRSLDVQASWRPWRFLQLRDRWEWNEKGEGRPATLGVVHEDAVDGVGKLFLAGSHPAFRSTLEATVFYGRYVELVAWWTEMLDQARGRWFGTALHAGW